MYYYNKAYLVQSTEYTNLVISEGDDKSLTYDPVTRSIIVVVLPGSKVQDLSIVKEVEIFDGEVPVEIGTYIFRRDEFILNGMRYFFQNGIDRFSQLHNTELPNQIFVDENMYFVSLNSEEAPITTWEEYSNLINEEGSAHVKLVDPNLFKLVNYYDLSLDNEFGRESSDTSSVIFHEINVSQVDIQKGYMDHLRKVFPEIEVGPELSDLTKINDKTNGYLMVTNGLYQIGTEFSVHPHRHPEWVRYQVVTIPTEVEYLTDDIMKFHEFRDHMFFDRKIFSTYEYKFTDRYDREWSAQSIYQYQVDTKLDRSPQSKYLNESNLYSFKFYCDLSGYLIEDYTPYPRIQRIIVNWRAGNHPDPIATKIIEID